MKADLVLVISPERGEKNVTIQHDETGLVVAYTSEERLNVKH